MANSCLQKTHADNQPPSPQDFIASPPEVLDVFILQLEHPVVLPSNPLLCWRVCVKRLGLDRLLVPGLGTRPWAGR